MWRWPRSAPCLRHTRDTLRPISLPLLTVVWLSFPSTRRVDRMILPKTCDTPPPTALLALAAWLPIAFRAHARNAGVGVARPSPAPANVSRPPATTSHAVSPDASRTYRHVRDAPGCGAGSDQPALRTCDSEPPANI